MKPSPHLLAATIAALAAAIPTPTAPAGQSLAIDWFTIDAGGGRSGAANFTLIATIGQPETGTQSGGDFTLHAGFISPLAAIPSTPDCPGDLNADQEVNSDDLGIILAQFGCTKACTADIDADGDVDSDDLGALLGAFGITCQE